MIIAPMLFATLLAGGTPTFKTGQDLLSLLEDQGAANAFMEGIAQGYVEGMTGS